MKERSVAPKDSIWDGKFIRYFCPMNIVPSSQCQQNKHARRRYNVVCYVSRKYERPSSAIGMIMTGAIAVGVFCSFICLSSHFIINSRSPRIYSPGSFVPLLFISG